MRRFVKILKNTSFYKLLLFISNLYVNETSKYPNKTSCLKDEGDRSSHLLPEIGECHLAIALIQFEQERAQSGIVT